MTDTATPTLCPECRRLVIGDDDDHLRNGLEWSNDKEERCEDCEPAVNHRLAVRRAWRKGFLPRECKIVQWQWKMVSDFERELYQVICRADEGNRVRLSLGFPDEVLAIEAWTNGDLGTRLRAAGIDI